MAEISEEGDKQEDVMKKESEGELVEEKTEEGVVVDTTSVTKNEVANNVCVVL